MIQDVLTMAGFIKKYNISKYTWDCYKKYIIDYYQEYIDFEEVFRPIANKNKLFYIIYEEAKEIPPLFDILAYGNRTPQQEYEAFTIDSLSNEYCPISPLQVTENSIASFGYKKYKHILSRPIMKKYILPAFDKFAESSNTFSWIDKNTYQPLTAEQKELWLEILQDNDLDEVGAAAGFFLERELCGFSDQIKKYNTALAEFQKLEDITPIYMQHWRRKQRKK